MTEIQVVIVGKSHTSKDNLVHIRPQGHLCHHVVVRLVRVGEERYLLAGHERVVEVDACNTGRDELRRLLSPVRVYRRAADLPLLSFNGRTSVYRLSVCVEEPSCKLFADLEGRRSSQKRDFSIRRYAFCS